MSESTDKAVLDLLQKVKQKKEEIAKASKKPVWKTNCTIGYDPENANRINIMTVRDVQKLADIYAFLLQREQYIEKAYKELSINDDLLVYMGYSIDDWKNDLRARVNQLSVEQKKKELDELDRRINSLVSPEQRREMELAELQKVLGE